MFTLIYNLYESINANKFLASLFATIIVCIGVCFVIYVINILANIRSYIIAKHNSIILDNRAKVITGNITLSMPDRIELTNSILDLISFMVKNEIISQLKTYMALNNQYEISKLDDDIKSVSQLVFDGINPTLFTDPNLILTKEYLMAFIAKKTTSEMLDIIGTYNSSIRSIKAQD